MLQRAREIEMPWDVEARVPATSSEEETLLQDSASGFAHGIARCPRASRWAGVAALLLCGAVAALGIEGGAGRPADAGHPPQRATVFPPHPPRRADARELAAILAGKVQMLQEVPETSEAFQAAKESFKNASGAAFSGSEFDAEYAKALFDNLTKGLGPKMTRDDNNTCADDEEIHAGLCYKTCELLTNGTHPYRTSAMSCCPTKNFCSPLKMRYKMSICGGFDVAGDSQGISKCPHPPGTCLLNEELYMGTCYAKCSDLTGGTFTNRISPMTCCKKIGYKCMDPRNLKTSTSHNVGGGAVDNDPATPAGAHSPMTSLTR
ncbi:unnamed protein product [Prorocentrum cordatum]|uniref:Uncharacterized protein n=1 Tax=Prorocentrum cordatum TaxID=2364126 RepID=A0ABN9Y873_9DINO|nr:unnamed protein product [Polarella glacialis]